LRMAQIIWAMTGLHQEGPQFYLLNGLGDKNYERAIKFCQWKKIQIVLESRTWYLANTDGTGFPNSDIRQATDTVVYKPNTKMMWFAPAGNDRGMVWGGR